ncbi:nuclear transport factor 2 family protein [Caldimonas thermodepolymerans]|mgnify:CR=1 FL=1|jgi:SnoaL-like polyketide cyclase.|uniref:SnoaL-like protein n=1 Tax=Caldimonas thermodepolymerans TaxID=215580 RepID=A0AA46DC34_9BURK|nr:nuclear transport factor 2 family protein [Caldimonas thermodepolymerans]TCP05025.1 SnoaL-like protein [Caldimonas thermodepolymerans]UZG44742.1 nuclear transport factor 2 family protein [Caldimonas thermodepolymerans]UZG48397.1 nuclear transport factor 2 family protein [Caldimonas thermodepolymerans]
MSVTETLVGEPRIARLVQYFESLSPAALERLGEIYAADCRFKDPFNEVRGLDAVRRIYAHMYATLDEPRFCITRAVVQGSHCVLTWTFQFRFRRRGEEQSVRGSSHLVLDAEGRITDHEDYWDAAGQFYEKLPLVGNLMRWLRRKVQPA